MADGAAAATKPDSSVESGVPDGAPGAGRRRLALASVAALVGLLAVAALAHWVLVGRWIQKTENAYVRADISIVAPKVEGYVSRVAVTDNQAVKAGDLLVQIDPAAYQAALARAKANLARAQAQAIASGAAARGAGGRLGQQGDQIAQAEAALSAAQADQARLALDRKRFGDLAAKGLVAPSRLEQIDAQAKQAAAAAEGAAAQVRWQREQAGVLASSRTGAGGDLAAANAAVQAAEADVAAASLNLDRTRIVAPFAGVVGDRVVREGQLVRPGVQLMAIVPVSQVYVIANFKETQLAKMRPGQKARVKIDAYPGLKIAGRVESLAPASGSEFSIVPTDTATGNFTKIVQRVPVKVSFAAPPEAGGLLRPGLSAQVEVDTNSAQAR